MIEYYKYKTQSFECKNCSWKGKGESLVMGDLYDELYEVHCPECKNKIGIVMLPTFDEVLKYGSEDDKAKVKEMMSRQEKIKTAELKSADQLPEIEKDGIIDFQLKVKDDNGEEYLVIFADGEEIWREFYFWEFFERYIELAKMLKQKYGSRMTDLDTCGFDQLLYGDCSYSKIVMVKKFRESLKD